MSQFLTTLFSTTMVMLIAEFGDKTNLIALSLMNKTQRPYLVAVGSTIGIFLTTLLGVLLGSSISNYINLDLIPVFAGFVFIILGIVSLLMEDEEEFEDDTVVSTENILLKSISLVALAELGDKSQIVVISGSTTFSPSAILIGATIGMGIIMFSTAIVGDKIFDYIAKERLEIIASILFIVVGLWLILVYII